MSRLLLKLRVAWRILGLVAITIGCWSGLELGFLLRGRRKKIDVINRWVPRWAGGLLWLYGVQTKIDGLDGFPGGAYPGVAADGVGRIFVLNHRSSLDIGVLLTYAQAHAISRHDLAHWPLIGPGARRIGTLFVNRADRRSGAEVLKEVDQALARGEGVGMFPEGTAFAGDLVRPFRPGAFKAAERAGAEIVPVGIAYDHADACYGEESFMSHLKRVAGLKRIRAAVVFGAPVAPDERTPIEVRDDVHQQVSMLVQQARARLGQGPQTESMVYRAGVPDAHEPVEK